MRQRKIVVPEGMLKVAVAAAWSHIGFSHPQASIRVQKEIEESFRVSLEAALRWLSENPIVPTDAQLELFLTAQGLPNTGTFRSALSLFAGYFQRRMFLAPEPEVPEEIEDLLWPKGHVGINHDQLIVEAYRRGQARR
jgi:hypothetical protein